MSIDIFSKVSLQLQNPNLWEFFLQNDTSIKFYVQNTTLPFFKFGVETQLPYAKYYNKLESLDDISVTFLETEDFKVTNFLTEWMETVYDFNNRVWKKINAITYAQKYTAVLAFQRNDVITKNSQGKSYQESIGLLYNKAYILKGIKILNINNYDLSYGNGEPFIITANFSINDIEEMETSKVPASSSLI